MPTDDDDDDGRADNDAAANGTRIGLKAIDERALNKLLNSVPADVVRDFLRKKLPEPSRRRAPIAVDDYDHVPRFIKTIVGELCLLDEPDMMRRYDLSLGYFRCRGYAANTVTRYLRVMRKHGLFGDGVAVENQRFDAALFYSEKHTRLVDKTTYARFVTYMLQRLSRFNAPLLFAFYTGLRTSEILQTTTYHLHQLLGRSPIVDIRRKNTARRSRERQQQQHADNKSQYKPETFWKPVYNAHLTSFAQQLRQLYTDEYEAFKNTGIDVRLFTVTPKTLVNRMNVTFVNATGRQLPVGFGVHGNRTTVASIMYDESPNLIAVQNYLQHRYTSSTRQYVRADVKSLAGQFDRITAEHFTQALETLAGGDTVPNNNNNNNNA